jgi:hypothetical protein
MNDGRISNITMTPTNEAMFACIKPLVEGSHFPPFFEPRQTINFTFEVHP